MQGVNTNTMSSSFKQAFLKNLLLGLQSSASTPSMSLLERTRAVKSSADVAMAAARGAGARWPKAILSSSSPSGVWKARRCRKIVRKYSCCRRFVKRRTVALREVIPGGRDAVDEIALLRETMDYIVHLRAQVDVLRRLSEAAQMINVQQLPY